MDGQPYSIVAKIDEGSFGDIFTVRCRSTKKIFALKQIAYRGNFRQDKYIMGEIDSLSRLNHSNIITLHKVLVTSKFVNLILEYAESGNLEFYLDKSHPMSEDVLETFCLQILSAVDYCHSRNIGHRDITPSNVLVTRNDVIKLGDFGLAVKTTDDKGDLVKCDDYLGNASYLSPEVLMETPFYPISADLWSTGTLLYYLVKAKILFIGSTDEIIEHMKKVTSDELAAYTCDNVTEQRIFQATRDLLRWDPSDRAGIHVILHSFYNSPDILSLQSNDGATSRQI